MSEEILQPIEEPGHVTLLSLNSIWLHCCKVSSKDLLDLRQFYHEGGQLNSELSKLLSSCLQWEAGGCVPRSLLDNLIPNWPVFWTGAVFKDILQWGRLHKGADPWVCTLILSGKQFEMQSTWHLHQYILNLMKAELHKFLTVEFTCLGNSLIQLAIANYKGRDSKLRRFQCEFTLALVMIALALPIVFTMNLEWCLFIEYTVQSHCKREFWYPS